MRRFSLLFWLSAAVSFSGCTVHKPLPEKPDGIPPLLVRQIQKDEFDDFAAPLPCYEKGPELEPGQQREGLRELFEKQAGEKRFADAEQTFEKLLAQGVKEKGFSVLFTFKPFSTKVDEEQDPIYAIYGRKIAQLISSSPNCRARIVGRSSAKEAAKSGKLARKRAVWVQTLIRELFPDFLKRSVITTQNPVKSTSGRITDSDDIQLSVEVFFEKCGNE